MFSKTHNEFTIIETWNDTLVAFLDWMANRPQHLPPVVRVLGGGGSDWIGCQIISIVTQKGGKIIVEQAFSFGCIYAMAKIADLSELRVAQTHPATNELYKSNKEKVYINHLHVVQILYYRDLLKPDLLAKYEKFSEKYRHLPFWDKADMNPDLFWDDITDWFKLEGGANA